MGIHHGYFMVIISTHHDLLEICYFSPNTMDSQHLSGHQGRLQPFVQSFDGKDRGNQRTGGTDAAIRESVSNAQRFEETKNGDARKREAQRISC